VTVEELVNEELIAAVRLCASGWWWKKMNDQGSKCRLRLLPDGHTNYGHGMFPFGNLLYPQRFGSGILIRIKTVSSISSTYAAGLIDFDKITAARQCRTVQFWNPPSACVNSDLLWEVWKENRRVSIFLTTAL